MALFYQNLRPVAEQVQVLIRNVGLAVGHDVGQHTGRPARHSPAKVPCPVLVYKLSSPVRPIMGVPSGVMGRRPVQNCAAGTLQQLGNRSVTECSNVARRGARRRVLKPASSAVPPIRTRSPSRVIPILKVSSIIVETGARAASVISAVSEYPLTG